MKYYGKNNCKERKTERNIITKSKGKNVSQ